MSSRGTHHSKPSWQGSKRSDPLALSAFHDVGSRSKRPVWPRWMQQRTGPRERTRSGGLLEIGYGGAFRLLGRWSQPHSTSSNGMEWSFVAGLE